MLRYHIKTIHEGIRPEKRKCRSCEKEFSTKKGLENHIKIVHDGIKPEKQKCNLCPREFSTIGRLKLHYKANICNSKRPQQRNVKTTNLENDKKEF